VHLGHLRLWQRLVGSMQVVMGMAAKVFPNRLVRLPHCHVLRCKRRLAIGVA
jgi:hypothetical protein